MKISVKKKSKGKMFSTARQDYSPEMKEYIFAIKGRPFAMLALRSCRAMSWASKAQRSSAFLIPR